MNLDDVTKDVLRGIAGVCEPLGAQLPAEAVATLYLRVRAVLRDAPAPGRSSDLAGEIALAAFLELAASASAVSPTVLPQLRDRVAATLAVERRELVASRGDHP
jgi:hypothetical protein